VRSTILDRFPDDPDYWHEEQASRDRAWGASKRDGAGLPRRHLDVALGAHPDGPSRPAGRAGCGTRGDLRDRRCRTATVLHYDSDYEAIAAITGQPARWLVPQGTLT